MTNSNIVNHAFGILGGTFDPIHNGHLRIAEEVADALGLPEVRIIPSGNPPHRAPPVATAQQRLDLCRLATQNNPRLIVDDREVLKPMPSYTIETLEALRHELPTHTPVLILGADAFLGLPKWHRWRALFDHCAIVLVQRPGYSVAHALTEPLGSEFVKRSKATNTCGANSAISVGKIFEIDVTALDISATRVRALLKAGKSVRYLVPDAAHTTIQRIYPIEQE